MTPICGAASPAPLASAMVSHISFNSGANASESMGSTGAETCSNLGSPIFNRVLTLNFDLVIAG